MCLLQPSVADYLIGHRNKAQVQGLWCQVFLARKLAHSQVEVLPDPADPAANQVRQLLHCVSDLDHPLMLQLADQCRGWLLWEPASQAAAHA